MRDEYLALKEPYQLGVDMHAVLTWKMLDGKPISCAEDMGLLAQIVHNSSGNHLEIGTAYGASAFVAIEAIEQRGRPGVVICIEPFGEERRDTVYKAVEKEFWRNVDHFGARSKIVHIKAFSHPLPTPKGDRYGTAFIDGDHSYEFVLNDWNNLKDVVDDYIMFHDYIKEEVRRVVIEHAARDKDWHLTAVHGWSAVMRRKRK